MITIRTATQDDVSNIVAMSLRFQETTTYAKHLRATEATLTTLVWHLLNNSESVIWLADDAGRLVGMLAASLYTQPMSGELIGTELCWWMNPEARGGRAALRMLRKAEQWALGRGATTFQMMAPTAAVGAFYEVLHYEPIETHYQRRLV